MKKHSFPLVAGFGFGLIVSACATTFPYKFFGLDLKDGKLLGPTPADDQSLSICEATPADASPCSVVMTAAYLELKKDYKDTKDALIACQQAR